MSCDVPHSARTGSFEQWQRTLSRRSFVCALSYKGRTTSESLEPNAIETARGMLEVSTERLWLDYAALGGGLSEDAVQAFLRGERNIRRIDFDLLTHAINELFMEIGANYPLPYAEDLAKGRG